MLEETGLEYAAHPINIRAGDQFKPEFLKISPNNKIPAIVDSDGPRAKPISVADSGAILVYLAEKSGKFLSQEPQDRYATLEWMMFQIGHVGPMLGQAHHFRTYALERFEREQVAYSIERYTNEANRLYGVLDRWLADREYMVGGTYSIADIAIWPWLRNPKPQGVDMEDYANVRRWFDLIAARPAVDRGKEVLADLRRIDRPHSDEEWSALYGSAQHEKR